LTGDADVEAAISAINQGNFFRFLTQPCPPAFLSGSWKRPSNITGCVQRSANGESKRHLPCRDFFREKAPSQGALRGGLAYEHLQARAISKFL